MGQSRCLMMRRSHMRNRLLQSPPRRAFPEAGLGAPLATSRKVTSSKSCEGTDACEEKISGRFHRACPSFNLR